MVKQSRFSKSASNIYLTPKGLEEARAELAFLTTTKRAQIAERIQRARELGDISENAEYDAALDEQALVENRIAYLEGILKNAQVIAQGLLSESVIIGSTVKISIGGKTEEFIIVGKVEADPAKKRISNESPLGSVLLGLRPGDTAEVTTPTVKYKVKVLSIR